MASKRLIYIPEYNFDLATNPKFQPILTELDITGQIYNQEIRKLLEKIPGIYFATQKEEISNFFGPRRFSIARLNFSKVFNYVQKKIDYLEIPLQDSQSYILEKNAFMFQAQTFKSNPLVSRYLVQNGVLRFEFEGKNEYLGVRLEKTLQKNL